MRPELPLSALPFRLKPQLELTNGDVRNVPALRALPTTA